MSNTNTSKMQVPPFHSVNHTSNLVWIDLEMSGLNPENSVILEIASIVTDNNLNILAEGPNLALHAPMKTLEAMDDWNQRHHRASGLINRVRDSSVNLMEAEDLTLEFISKYCHKGEAPLCGNSIGQDRRFLRKYMPRLEEHFHYRNIDVSTLKELIIRWHPNYYSPPKKMGRHMALYDIRESINELKYYKEQFISHDRKR